MCADGHEGLMMQASFLVNVFVSGRDSGYNVKQQPFPDFRAGRKGSPVSPPFAGHRRGRSLRLWSVGFGAGIKYGVPGILNI